MKSPDPLLRVLAAVLALLGVVAALGHRPLDLVVAIGAAAITTALIAR